MIDITLLAEARIAARCGDLLRSVGTLAELSALTDAKVPLVTPAAYVIPHEIQARDNQSLSDQVQAQRLALGVALIVRHAGDASGARALQTLQTLRDAVMAALGGWSPAGCMGSLQYEGGSLIDEAPSGVVAWQDLFTVARMAAWPAAAD